MLVILMKHHVDPYLLNRKHIKFSRNNIKFHMFLMCYFFQNLHIGKFFYMGNSIMVRFYSMDC